MAKKRKEDGLEAELQAVREQEQFQAQLEAAPEAPPADPAPQEGAPDVHEAHEALGDAPPELAGLLDLAGAIPGDGSREFEVKLKHAPTLVVRAEGPEDAWEVYKAEMGVIRADHPPEITEVS